MSMQPEHGLTSFSRAAPHVAGAWCLAVGALALAGWFLGAPGLQDAFPGLAPVQANAAACILLLGAASSLAMPGGAGLSRRVAGFLCVAPACLLACLTLIEWFAPTGLGLDLLLLGPPPERARMAFFTALVVLLLGPALCLTAPAARWAAELLAAVSVLVCLLALTGDVFRLSFPTDVPARRSALLAVSALLALGLAVLAARPDLGWASVVFRPGPGGALARWLLLAAVLVPFCLGWLQLFGLSQGYFRPAFGVVLFVVASTLVFSALSLWFAEAFNRLDARRSQAEQALRESEERLRLLHQIDKALIAGDAPEEIAAAALPPLRGLLRANRVVVNLFDLEKGEVEWLAAAGRRRLHVGPGVRYPLTFMGDVEALRRGEPQLVDVKALPPGPEADALLASEVHSYAVVPMSAGGELIGALSFGGGEAGNTPGLVEIAQEVAAQFAVALAHARLHEHVRRQARELEGRVRERTRELEKAHAELQDKNAQLTLLAAELESFSYSVSHDLRAPLRAINGFSRILMEKFAGQLPEAARDHLQEVHDSAREMGQLVDGLLAFSRLGRQAMRSQPVDQAEAVRDCLETLRPELAGRRVEVSVGELPPARGDPVLLKQVWMNLLSNALKYTGKTDVARVEISGRKGAGPDHMVTYYVRDNGVGFDMKYAHKLFGVFQRLHRAEEYEGTGVGLAIVQRIVQRHGGRVWAEARRGEGATFYFTLKEASLE